MFLGDLPLEIQYNILEHCSPSDLAVLSRVHTLVRDAAEYTLYAHIRYCAHPLNMIVTVSSRKYQVVPQGLKENKSLLYTFATNSRKASMVKAFYVELEREGGDGNAIRFVLAKLAEALEKMPNLVDLRIIPHSPIDDLSEGRISQVIRGGHFKLHTLYVEHCHDLEGIIADQPQLRLLGIYSVLGPLHMILWTKVEQLYQSPSRRRTMPIVFVLGYLTYFSPPPWIHMLPSFYRPGEALQVCRETAVSLNKWRNGFDGKLSLSLIGISKENISLLGEVIGAMATCRDYYPSKMYSCLNVILHDKYIQKPWRFPEFVKPIALLEYLEGLHFYLPDVEEEVLRLLSTDLQSWVDLERGTWPTIQQLTLRGRGVEENILLDRESEWTDEDDVYDGDVYDGYDSYGGYDSSYDSEAYDI